MASSGTSIDLDALRTVKSSIDRLQNSFDRAGESSLDEMAGRCTINWGSWNDPGSQWISDHLATVAGAVRDEVMRLKADLSDIAALLQTTIDQHQAAEDANAAISLAPARGGSAPSEWTV